MTKRKKSLKNISFTNAARKRQQTLNWLLGVDWPFSIWFSLFIGLFQRNFSILARKMRHSARQSDNQPKLNVCKGVTSVLNYGNASRVLDTHLSGWSKQKNVVAVVEDRTATLPQHAMERKPEYIWLPLLCTCQITGSSLGRGDKQKYMLAVSSPAWWRKIALAKLDMCHTCPQP